MLRPSVRPQAAEAYSAALAAAELAAPECAGQPAGSKGRPDIGVAAAAACVAAPAPVPPLSLTLLCALSSAVPFLFALVFWHQEPAVHTFLPCTLGAALAPS